MKSYTRPKMSPFCNIILIQEQKKKQGTEERNQFMRQYVEWWPLEDTVDYLVEMVRL